MSGDPSHGEDARHAGHGSHAGHPDHAAASRRALLVALAINTAFFVVELVGALLADSVTLLADATHMLTDSASLLLALFAAWVSTRPADARRTYGYHRAEVLGALVNGLFLLGVVGYVVYDALRRFGDPRPVDASLVVAVGVVGLVANLVAAWVLSGHRDSLNVEGAFLHLLADAAGSVAAVVLGLTLLVTDWYVLDPVFALVVAALVSYSVWDLLRDSLNILLQGTPRGLDVDEIRAALAAVDGVADVHHLHVWALDSQRVALSGHLVTTAEADGDAILGQTQRLLGDRFGVDHATLQLEGAHVETAAFDCHRPTTHD
ncbi:cobalt-zinc-cadmium efflux system protein [Halogranum amylolyticum]|uniref:Cobalt-zinc-cadmium efflux system protein n=1 Tax=Halogranum amylolyticum TaxID=660520 RepID=A0A1H8TUK9_9EURY|nr:cation diffusion facilitator family transporter [Halogranum amylolyticum]SEO94223.1 cobalt-zinc-cadmium efflux system protein [Halogranum amylolyticum]